MAGTVWSEGNALTSLALREVGPNPVTASPDEISALTDVPVFLGYMFSYFLDGILIVQVFLYYLSFRRKDHLYMKIAVFFVFFIEFFSTMLATAIVIMSIIEIGDLSNSIALWGFKVVAVLYGICSTMVHAFYCWRIRILHGSWWIIAAIMTLSVVQCVMVAISGTGVFQPKYSGFLGAGTASTTDSGDLAINVLWLAGGALCDIMIATTLISLLNRVKTRLPLKSRTERIMSIVIYTGMITAIATCIELLFFLILPQSLVHFVMFYAIPKLYANCFMANLNSRPTVTGEDVEEKSRFEWDASLRRGSLDDDSKASLKSSMSESSVLDIKRLSSSEPLLAPAATFQPAF